MRTCVEALEARQLLAGELDTTFGTSGWSNVGDAASKETLNSIILDSAGRIVLGGNRSGAAGASPGLVARLMPGGALDSTFGTGGVVTINDPGYPSVNSVVVLDDGKMVVALTDTVSFRFRLKRFMPNGQIDTTFGTNGLAQYPFRDGFGGSCRAMAVLPNGQILAAGSVRNNLSPSNWRFGLTRFNANGSVDTTFGDSGQVITDLQVGEDAARYVFVRPDGKILLVGMASSTAASRLVAAVQYNANGSLDTTFGSQGTLITALKIGPSATPPGAILLGDGSLLLAGHLEPGTGDAADVGIHRYGPTGTQDLSFGNSGTARLDFPGVRDDMPQIALSSGPDGRIIVVAKALGSTSLFSLGALYANGTRDVSFDPRSTIPVASSAAIPAGVIALPNGQILVGMTKGTMTTDMVVARFVGLLSADAGGPYTVAEMGQVSLAGRTPGNSGLQPATLEWDFNYDGTRFDIDATGANPVLHNTTVGNPAAITVALRVRDSYGNLSPVSTALVNVTNSAPVVSITADSELKEGDVASFDASIMDSLDDLAAMTYRWEIRRDGALLYSSNQLSIGMPTSDSGGYAVTLTVTDKDGASATATRPFSVANVAPTVSIFAPAAPDEGSTVTVTSSAYDPGVNDTLSYAWTVVRDGQVVWTGTAADATFTVTDNVPYLVSLTVIDSDGASSPVMSETILPVNVGPSMSLPAAISSGIALELSGFFTDPGADAWTGEVDYGDGLGFRPLTLEDKAFTLGTTYNDSGTFNVVVRITDDEGAAAEQQIVVTAYAPPRLISILVNDGDIQRSGVQSLTVTFDAPITLSDGALTVEQTTGQSIPFTIANPSGDRREYVLEFGDGSSLADGRYNLIFAPPLTCDEYGQAMPAVSPFSFHRLFADANGDGDVIGREIGEMHRSTAGRREYLWYYDLDNDADVDVDDWAGAVDRLRTVI